MATVSEIMRRSFVKLDASTTIMEALGVLKQSDERYALIFDKQHKPDYRGILDRVLLIESKLDPKAEIGTFATHPPVVTEDTEVFKAAELMFHSYPAMLPVRRKDKIIAVVRARDILSLLPNTPALARLKVTSVASTSPMTFKHNARLGDVINLMKEKHFSHAPIIDDLGRIVSVFSLTDLFEKHLSQPIEKRQGLQASRRRTKGTFTGAKTMEADKDFILNTEVGGLASVDVVTASPSDTLGSAVKEMSLYKISDIIIAQDRRPVGIITTKDLLQAFFRARAPEYWGIQFFGCEDLPGPLNRSIREQVAEFYEKVKRDYFRDIIYFLVHIKQYEKKPSKRRKYSIHLRLAIPARVFTAEQAHFDLNTGISWAIKAMNQQLLSFREKTRERRAKGKKGRRARYEHFIQREAEKEGRERILRPKLVKRK